MLNNLPRRIRWDGFLLSVLSALCLALAVLQYRWLGELSRAEGQRLRSSLNEQIQAVGRAFDLELNQICRELLPTAASLDEQGHSAAHARVAEQWATGEKTKQLFSRIAIVTPKEGTLEIAALDRSTGGLHPQKWPSSWMGLQSFLLSRLEGGRVPMSTNLPSPLINFPVFEDVGGRTPREREWVLFELNLDYVRDVWLPSLVETHLNPGKSSDYEILVVDASKAGQTIFSSTGIKSRSPSSETFDAITRFFPAERHRLERPVRNYRSPSDQGRWVLSARHQAGSLDIAVAAAHRRNLVISGLLLALIAAAGVALVRLTRQARQLADMRIRFVANVSHELRTPLTVIRGAAHNLKRGVVREPEQIEQYSGLILQHAEQLAEMVEQLLELAGARSNQDSAQLRQPISVADVLQDAIAAAAEDARASDCAVQADIPENLPAVLGYAPSLGRAFQNLLSNAAKHAADGRWIGVSALVKREGSASMVEVRISDRGQGIEKSEQSKIFMPFVRGSRAEANQIRGSGLGLSLVREIVEWHHGKVFVVSQPGQGATFVVQLPPAAEPPSS
jgi:signal transduction histidine kinase